MVEVYFEYPRTKFFEDPIPPAFHQLREKLRNLFHLFCEYEVLIYEVLVPLWDNLSVYMKKTGNDLQYLKQGLKKRQYKVK